MYKGDYQILLSEVIELAADSTKIVEITCFLTHGTSCPSPDFIFMSHSDSECKVKIPIIFQWSNNRIMQRSYQYWVFYCTNTTCLCDYPPAQIVLTKVSGDLISIMSETGATSSLPATLGIRFQKLKMKSQQSETYVVCKRILAVPILTSHNAVCKYKGTNN